MNKFKLFLGLMLVVLFGYSFKQVAANDSLKLIEELPSDPNETDRIIEANQNNALECDLSLIP